MLKTTKACFDSIIVLSFLNGTYSILHSLLVLTRSFLRALQPPGWRKEWHCGVRVVKSNVLVAFIGAIPSKIQVREAKIDMVEINFLCVHKSLRSKRVTPVMIREITRRANINGIFQAAYTAGVELRAFLNIANVQKILIKHAQFEF